MKAEEYFEEVVRPFADELGRRRNDRAFIMAAAIVTFHAADWIAKERKQKKEAVRQRILIRFPDFKYLGAVAIAHKHMTVTNGGEFCGLTDPLTPESAPEDLLDDSSGVLCDESGNPLTDSGKVPMYIFTDGIRKNPLSLVEGSVEAIAAEFE